MRIAPGDRVGPDEVVARLGEGGMSRLFRSRTMVNWPARIAEV